MTVRINPRLALSLDLRQDGAGSSRGSGGDGPPPAPPLVRLGQGDHTRDYLPALPPRLPPLEARGRRGPAPGFGLVVLVWVVVAAIAGSETGGGPLGLLATGLVCLLSAGAITLLAWAEIGARP